MLKNKCNYGLNEYDFTGRWQDPGISSFTSIDPLCEKYYSVSPYVYCLDNPINHIDPDGRNPILALYRAYRGYKAYRAARVAATSIRAADAAAATTVATTTTVYSYNYFLNPEQAAQAQQSLLDGMKNAVNQNAAVSPEYSNQRKCEREAKNQLDQEQANIAKSIDTNISGTMPNGDPVPKRDPNDGRKGTKTIIDIMTVIAGARCVLELTNPDPSKDAVEAHEEKVKNIQSQPVQNDQGLWENLKKWIFNK